MPTYHIDPDQSQVWIVATSSVHPIHGEAKGLEGSISAELNGGGFDLATPPRISLELPVERLQSGNRFEDTEMMRRIDARRYPKIRGEVRDVREAGPGRYRFEGDVTFHGVTRAVEGDVTLQVNDSTLVLEGEQTFDIRDYHVQPPKILMLRVHPDVKVRIRVVAQQAN